MKVTTLPFELKKQRRLRTESKPLYSQTPYKRLFDVAFSLFILSVLSPLFLIIALSIKLTSKGSVIYTQLRLGTGGKIFKCYKFRTMHPKADSLLKEILEKDPQRLEEWKHYQKLRYDPRVLRFGHFLRKTSLDELPQFWNVLKGDLSVVGPRPYIVSQKKEMGHQAKVILSVRPGITGLWQTSGRSNTSFQNRLLLDACYAENHSFWIDLWFILKTIPQMLFSKNAF